MSTAPNEDLANAPEAELYRWIQELEQHKIDADEEGDTIAFNTLQAEIDMVWEELFRRIPEDA